MFRGSCAAPCDMTPWSCGLTWSWTWRHRCPLTHPLRWCALITSPPRMRVMDQSRISKRGAPLPRSLTENTIGLRGAGLPDSRISAPWRYLLALTSSLRTACGARIHARARERERESESKRERGREKGREGRLRGGREGAREGTREGAREGGKEGGREGVGGGREKGREGGRSFSPRRSGRSRGAARRSLKTCPAAPRSTANSGHRPHPRGLSLSRFYRRASAGVCD